MKIMIVAGHGGYDSGAIYNERKEKDDNLDLALAVGEVLEKNGIDVVYGRTKDVYKTEAMNAVMANDENVEYVIAFHRNFVRKPNESSGVLAIVDGEDEQSIKLAKKVNDELAKIGFKELGIEVRKDRDILSRTKMPGIIFMVGFINNDKDNLMFDEKFDVIVNTIASKIYEEATGEELQFQENNDTIITSSVEMKLSKYYVQLGLFRNYKNVNHIVKPLKAMGYPVRINECGGFYVISVGDVNTLSEANALEEDLKMLGYETLLLKR